MTVSMASGAAAAQEIQCALLALRQCLPGVDHDRRLTRMMVVLCNRVHRVVGVGPVLVDTLNGAVANGTAIVPGNLRACRDRLERGFLGRSHVAAPAWSAT